MNDPERPPLNDRAFEEIKVAIHAVDQRHWPLLVEFQVPNYHPLSKPVPPQRPVHFQDAVVAYALDLFKCEADFYAPFRAHANYPPWLSRLADRTGKKVIEALKNIEDGNQSATIWFHGVSWLDVNKAVHTFLWRERNTYVESSHEPQHTTASLSNAMKDAYANAGVDALSGSPLLLMAHAAAQRNQAVPAVRQRMSASVHSPSAALKMEAYMKAKGFNQTEFAIRAGTTDKTVRKFRQTGRVKLSILGDIAKAMGTTKEQLLSQ